ncbi:MAG: tRNA preQ1(34) S-adenosylmethionine ribosyltransferase-isomerase QueA [Gammaproteobacteria bacterium]|jgi:S-adenosylmethionine:tRNA ribosyltransferase-isomerase
MKRTEFHYDLPDELIAQYPLKNREDSRLLCLHKHSGTLEDQQFRFLLTQLKPDDLLIFNDSKVLPARLYGNKESGGKVEILIERVINNHSVLAHVRASKSPKPGNNIVLENGECLLVDGREDDLFILSYNGDHTVIELMEMAGHIPLPPYIRREDELEDKARYQTVYARNPGAIAAPTAGLHFSRELLNSLDESGVNVGYITLHVGAGTFQPVRADLIEDHKMHTEWYQIDESLCVQVDETKKRGGRVIAVGTTVVRCLESASITGSLQPYSGDTDIFIFPGYKFKVIDGMITNFHLSESTLLMLVCALAGKENIFSAYNHAIDNRYRFFSYGDAMLIV